MHTDDKRSRGKVDDNSTGEYPFVSDDSPTAELEALPATALAFTDEPAGGDKRPDNVVSGSLAHLEGELARLQNRWQQVGEQLNAKDLELAALRGEIQSRDATAGELKGQLAESRLGLQSLEEALRGKHADIAKLTLELEIRNAGLAEREAKLAAAGSERLAAQHELAAARTEIARLTTAIEREQASVATAGSAHEELAQAHAALNLRVQELEAYIDGRAANWSTLNNEIADRKNAVLRLEKLVKTQELGIEDAARHKRELENTIAELEHHNAELETRRKERDSAYEALRSQLADERTATDKLKEDLTERSTELQRSLANTAEGRKRLTALEESATLRGASLAKLEIEFAAERTRVAELTTERDSLAARTAELERALREQAERYNALQADLQAAHERLRASEAALDARTTELTTSREQSAHHAREATRLVAEVATKQASLDLLERSVERLDNLGASVAELERRLDPNVAPGAAAPPAATPPAEATAILAAPATSMGTRRLVGRIDGERFSFPVTDGELTIGRSKQCGIRIASHYISRVHARISTRGNTTTIEDVGSKNGIFVNRERITSRELRDGDLVTLANEIVLRFVDARH